MRAGERAASQNPIALPRCQPSAPPRAPRPRRSQRLQAAEAAKGALHTVSDTAKAASTQAQSAVSGVRSWLWGRGGMEGVGVPKGSRPGACPGGAVRPRLLAQGMAPAPPR
jgi:hypothetical protein